MSAVGSSQHAQSLSAEIQSAVKHALHKGIDEQEIIIALERIGRNKHHSADMYRALWHQSAEHCNIIRQMWHKDICSLVIDPEELNEALNRVSELESGITNLERQNREYREQRRREEQLLRELQERQGGWRKQWRNLRQRCTTWLPLRRPAC